MESLQFVHLCVQEMHNVWRKRALSTLTDEVNANASAQSGAVRMRRFADGAGGGTEWERACVAQFREPIGFPVPDVVPVPVKFGGRLRGLVEEHEACMPGLTAVPS